MTDAHTGWGGVFCEFVIMRRISPLYHTHYLWETEPPFRTATGHIMHCPPFKLGVVIGRWTGQWSGNQWEAIGGREIGEWSPAGDPGQPEAAAGEDPPAGATGTDEYS
jgi:hypothetical protein